MCGIVGYVGDRARSRRSSSRACEKLEYRGYDSAGISILNDGAVRLRARGRQPRRAATSPSSESPPPTAPRSRSPSARRRPASATPAGPPTAASTRPTPTRTPTTTSASTSSSTASSRTTWSSSRRCSPTARRSRSETDAEVVAHLISQRIEAGDDLVDAVLAAYARIRGHYAFVAVSADEPELLVGARKECPLVIGRGEGEQFVASAIPAFLAHTRQRAADRERRDRRRAPRRRRVPHAPPASRSSARSTRSTGAEEVAEKGGYETFMLKEIHEQADAVAETIADRTARGDGVDLGELGTIDDAFLRDCNRIVVVACGTSYHAGLIGRYALEQWARVPVEMDIASEYRYRDPVVGPRRPRRSASPSRARPPTRSPPCAWPRSAGRRCSRSRTSWARRPRATPTACSTRAPGLEVGVAATKTFVAQVAAMYLLGAAARRAARHAAARAADASSSPSSSTSRTTSTRCSPTG